MITIPNFVGKVRHSYKKDGHLSWFVCFCACVANASVMGIDQSFGELFGSIKKDFNATEDSVAWINSVQVSVHNFSASLFSMFAEKLGFGPVIAIATLLLTISMALSVISNSVSILTLCYGVFAGFALGLIYTPCNIMCSFHFTKRRSLATGIAVCGGGIGIIIVSEGMNFVVQNYGWRGCMIICACVSPLNGLMAMLACILPDHNDVPTSEKNEKNVSSADKAVKSAK